MELRDGLYRVRKGIEPVREWVGENRRAASLIGVAGALLVAYLIFFTGPYGSRDIDILYRPRPDHGTVVFYLGDEYRLRSIKVVMLDHDGTEGQVTWHLKRNGRSKPLSTFEYGRSLPGMAAADNTPAHPLTGGATYRLTVVTADGRASVDFQIESDDPSLSDG